MANKINVKLILELHEAKLSRNTIAKSRHMSCHSEINVNMNQIALKVNASGIIDTKAYWENISIFQQVYSLLSKKNLPLKIEGGRGVEQIIHKAATYLFA